MNESHQAAIIRSANYPMGEEAKALSLFDYSGINAYDVDTLRRCESTIRNIQKATFSKIAAEVYAAHSVLANYHNGLFGRWCSYMGFSRDTGDNYVRSHKLIIEQSCQKDWEVSVVRGCKTIYTGTDH